LVEHPHVFLPEPISAIVGITCSKLAEPLAWRTSHDYVGGWPVHYIGNIRHHDPAIYVLTVRLSGVGVDLDCADRFKAGLTESICKAATTSKQVEYSRAARPLPHHGRTATKVAHLVAKRTFGTTCCG
jgi:hypothetical protein